MQTSKARGASVTRPLLRLKCSLFSGSDTPLTHYETSVWATLVSLLFMTNGRACLISGFVPLALSDQIHLPKYPFILSLLFLLFHIFHFFIPLPLRGKSRRWRGCTTQYIPTPGSVWPHIAHRWVKPCRKLEIKKNTPPPPFFGNSYISDRII